MRSEFKSRRPELELMNRDLNSKGVGEKSFPRGGNSESSSVRDRGSLKRSEASSEILGAPK